MIKTKEKELKSINKDIVNYINTLLTTVSDKTNSNGQIEEYKKLLLSKDNEIAKLTDLNLSKENEISRLNKLIEDMKKGSITQEMEENFKKEKEKLLGKINNLELKIYSINDEKTKLSNENKKLNEKLSTNNTNNESEKKNRKKNGTKNENKTKNSNNNENNTKSKENIGNNENPINNEKYEELLKIKQDLEEQNIKLIEEIESLKNKSNEEYTKIKPFKEEKNNKENNFINKEEIEELKRIIEEYKNGKIIPESAKMTIESLKNKNKNYESKISDNNKMKKDFENIIFKQENKINELNSLLKKKDSILYSKESSISKNEIYSIQLMNKLNEQKLQIKKLKKQKSEEDLSQIAELKRKIANLENMLEIKENTILNMKKAHKNLQDRYMKFCIKSKNIEQDFHLKEAKLLRNLKVQKDSLRGKTKINLGISNNSNLPLLNDESNGVSGIDYPNVNTQPNINFSDEKEKIDKNNDIILPVISPNKSLRMEDINNDNLINDDENKLEKINVMMEKIIDEE